MQGLLIETTIQHRPNLSIRSHAALAREAKGPELAVLSLGLGQDSTAILLKLIYDKEFRQKYAPNRLLVVTAETNDENPKTYETLVETKELCLKHGIEFVHITPEMGFHSEKWPGLREFYNRTKTVGSKMFPKTCTVRLKIDPIYKYIESYLGERYGVRVGLKKGYGAFTAKYGKIRMMVGLAQGEEKRVAKPEAFIKEAWRRDSITTVYPLIDLGYGRAECQKYIISVGFNLPVPSNCRLCPFMNEQELVWMHRFMPSDLEDWIRIERNKIDNNRHMDSVPEKDKNGDPKLDKNGNVKLVNKNYGVWGVKLLPEVLVGALAKFGHLTDDELWEHKMSHGHCVSSSW